MNTTTINTAKRLIKRIILTNIVSDREGLAITPLISGSHGIGKSQMVKQVAEEIGGTCFVVEGGALKEGEITGLPYQSKGENGESCFDFLPYYAVRWVQDREKKVGEINDIPADKRLEAVKSGKVEIVLILFDEINRTEPAVYKELMNILLTRSVNGYKFPWWVQIVGAMNPSSQNSLYAVNDMDPAQLDRFLKIKVSASRSEWLEYAEKANICSQVFNFIKNNSGMLTYDDEGLEDSDEPTPSPRGWEMISLLIKNEPHTRSFFTDENNKPENIKHDLLLLTSSKIGAKYAAAFFNSFNSLQSSLLPEDILNDDIHLSNTRKEIQNMSEARILQTCDNLLEYIKGMPKLLDINSTKTQLSGFIRLLDNAIKVRFVQNLMNTKELSDKLADVIDDDILDFLDLDNQLENSILNVNL